MQETQKRTLSDLITSLAVPAWHLRLWSSPEVILLVTNFADEQTLLLEAMRQAKRSTAKILLAYVARPSASRRMNMHVTRQGRPQSAAHDAQVMLERMTRQLRWAGIPSEPVLLQGLPAEEIPQLVRLRGVNRVIVTTHSDPRSTGIGSRAIAEQILPRVTVPVCIVGKNEATPTRFAASHSSIMLAISPRMRCDLLLEFACRFAQEMRSALTVLYVADKAGSGSSDATPNGFQPREQDPLWLLQKAQMSFPFTTIFAKGDLVEQVLAHDKSQRQDFILLGSERTAWNESSDEVSAPVKLAHETTCPLLILGNAAGKPVYDKSFSAQPNPDTAEARKGVQPSHAEVDFGSAVVQESNASYQAAENVETL